MQILNKWHTTAIGQLVPKLVEAIEKEKEELTKTLSKVDQAIEAVQQKISGLRSLTKQLEQDMENASKPGFYIIYLSPLNFKTGERIVGSWPDLLQSADDSPPNSSNYYSAVYAQLIVSVTYEKCKEFYDTLREVFSSFRFNTIISATPSPSMVVEEPEEKEPLEPNIWHDATLGEAFPGFFQSVTANLELVGKKLEATNSTLEKLLERKNKLVEAIDTLEKRIKELLYTGVYTIVLGPSKGGWLDRMVQAENAPPMDPNYYVAGLVIVAVSYDLSFLEEHWNSLKLLLGI